MSESVPALITCQAGTELLEGIVRELGRLGVGDPAAAATPLDAGVEVIVLDACPSACGSRIAAARGAKVVAALNLADLGGAAALSGADVHDLALRAAEAIRAGAARSRPGRPSRPERSMPRASGAPHTVDDYLLAIDALSSPVVECGVAISGAPTLASHVSDALGVSRPTAGEMLAKLEAGGLVHRDERKELLLTDLGRAAADRTLHRQRLLEVFAVDVLGYDLPAAWDQARHLREAFDDDASDRLSRALGAPSRCPHGWLLDAAAARVERSTLRALDAVEPGDGGTVIALAEGDEDVLARLAQLGVVPGVRVLVRRMLPSRERELDMRGTAAVVAERVCRAVFVDRQA